MGTEESAEGAMSIGVDLEGRKLLLQLVSRRLIPAQQSEKTATALLDFEVKLLVTCRLN